jgi:hypothetical protein
MNGYVAFAMAIFAFVLVGVTWRIRRTHHGSPLVQLLGGMNVFAAALLAWMTAVALFTMFNGELGLWTALLKWSSVVFVIACAILWVTRGLVPHQIEEGKAEKVWRGHLLLLIGTLAHGSVTFYAPVLIWLGVLDSEAGAVLPWLAIFTLPVACVLWAIGFTHIFDSRSNKRLQATRETRAPEA